MLKYFWVIFVFYENIKRVPGVGPARESDLKKLGIKTIGDMLYHFPRKLDDRSNYKKIAEICDGDYVTVRVTPKGEMTENRIKKNMTVYKQTFLDESGAISVSWFNSPYLKLSFKQGQFYYLCGKASARYSIKQMTSPIFEAEENRTKTGRIMPVYPLCSGLSQNIFTSFMQKALKLCQNTIPEVIPPKIRHKYQISQIEYALNNIHFPKDIDSFEVAKRRLKFEEFFVMQCGLLMKKGTVKAKKTLPIKGCAPNSFYERLPFTLTGAQKRVIGDVYEDLKRENPMNRLVQGDVGSGKTMIAAYALLCCAMADKQGVLMVPSEILATQHYESLSSLFPDFEVVLLSGKLTAKEKKEAYGKIASGEAKIIVGTHALIFDKVKFLNLSLVITDEQHRFGVNQRRLLSEKGKNPHTLVMSATPIPRTLTHVLYGDLDVSIIDELPPGRQKIDTFYIDSQKRERAYNFALKEIEKGNQVYVVCPLADESENVDLMNIKKLAKELSQGVFKNTTLRFIHGKMKSSEKEEIMQKFSEGEIKVLVSTTVIEVGINVPKATIMIIENAERFGLSGLHQLRGRVGRGSDKSYCILISDKKGELTEKRLSTLSKTSDGFEIANQDLALRGPGDFFGTKQHGLPELKIANIFEDSELLLKSREAAQSVIEEDKNLSLPKHSALKARATYLFTNTTNN